MTTITYLNMLEKFVFSRLEYYPPADIFQQDGDPPVLGLEVGEALDRQFPDRWTVVMVQPHG